MKTAREPVIWVLQGHREGDNAQARELARRLGYGFVLKPLRYRPWHRLPNLLLGAGLATIDRARSAPLAPPWPGLVIGVGKRSVPVMRWIRRQTGGAARLVQLGRPRAPLAWFDLVVSTPQYGLPPAPNVVELPLPLAVPVAPPDADLARWSQRFSALPRPWTAILVGGARYPFRFGPSIVRQLVNFAGDDQASLLVSTSPRTPMPIVAELQSVAAGRSYVHRWSAASDNSHQAILALADRFVVTSDSVSMMAEAAHTGKPVRVFDLPQTRWQLSWSAKRGLGAWLARHGLLSPPRRTAAIRLDANGGGVDIVQRVRQLMRET